MTIRSLTYSIFAAVALSLGGAAALLAAPAVPAHAQTSSAKSIVDKAITDGIVGETASGYLALAQGSAAPEIVNAMNEVNSGRKTVYTRLAREQNIQIAVVAALTGEKQLAKARPGEKIMTKEGRWITVK